jgi:ribosomal protein S5
MKTRFYKRSNSAFVFTGRRKKYTSLLATGNYHGDFGFAKAKGPTAKIAIQRVWTYPDFQAICKTYV